MMYKTLLFTVLIALGLGSCKKSGVDPVLTAENALVNSKDPRIFLSGDYLAVYAAWTGSYQGTEGQNWVDSPTTMTGNYKINAQISSKGDSLVLTINGSGHGPTFANEKMGTFGISADMPNGGVAGKEVYTNWLLRDSNIKNQNFSNMYASRSARTTNTLFTFEFTLSKVTNSKAADYGHYIAYSPDRSNELTDIGHFIFRRLSTGVVQF